MIVNIRIKGANELRRKLMALEPRIAKKVLRKALRAGAKIIHAEARSKSPVDTGLLRGSLKVRAMTRTRRKVVGVKVETREGFYRGEAFYGAFVEFGHRVGHRKLGDQRAQVPGKHFIEQAAKDKAKQAVDAITYEIARGVEQVARG